MISESLINNSGITFGVFRGIPTYVIVGVLIVLMIYAVKVRELIERIALLFMIAGGVGNTYMRIRYGGVIDNLNFFGIFYNNIWDYLIVMGVALYGVQYLVWKYPLFLKTKKSS